MDGQEDEWNHRKTEGRMNRTDEKKDRWMKGRMSGRKKGQMHGRTDGQTEG